MHNEKEFDPAPFTEFAAAYAGAQPAIEAAQVADGFAPLLTPADLRHYVGPPGVLALTWAPGAPCPTAVRVCAAAATTPGEPWAYLCEQDGPGEGTGADWHVLGPLDPEWPLWQLLELRPASLVYQPTIDQPVVDAAQADEDAFGAGDLLQADAAAGAFDGDDPYQCDIDPASLPKDPSGDIISVLRTGPITSLIVRLNATTGMDGAAIRVDQFDGRKPDFIGFVRWDPEACGIADTDPPQYEAGWITITEIDGRKLAVAADIKALRAEGKFPVPLPPRVR